MANHDGSDDKRLQAVDGPTDGRQTKSDPTAGLREALGTLEAKVSSPDGSTDLGDWLREIEEVVAGIRAAEIDATREEIRGVIDQLLELNAQIQNLVRLKQLLT